MIETIILNSLTMFAPLFVLASFKGILTYIIGIGVLVTIGIGAWQAIVSFKNGGGMMSALGKFATTALLAALIGGAVDFFANDGVITKYFTSFTKAVFQGENPSGGGGGR